MTFVEYCIATKNYSAIKAVKDYSSEVRQFAMSKKAKVAAGAAGAAGIAALIGASDTKAGRKIREALGMETLHDKYAKYGGDKIDSTLDDVNDSMGRKLRNALGMNTLRDKGLNLKDDVHEKLAKLDDDVDDDTQIDLDE